MVVTSPISFMDALREHRLIDAVHFHELQSLSQPRGWDAHGAAQYTISQNWLTPFQVNQILQGHGASLLFGHYVLLERLGEGGMAKVFKARHRLLDRIVALKVIRPEYLNKPEAVTRFRREVQAAAQLSHPNIVLALDAGEMEGQQYFVMQYVEGNDLARLVKAKGPLSADRACDFIHQAALGLQHIHENGLVHRDIKPSNLMLTRGPSSADRRVVKILDMGLARSCLPDDSAGNMELTHTGVLIGTPEYLAPEQAADPHGADIRADLYSLGCTFYYLLTGQVPFPGGTTIEKLFKHRLEQPRPLAQLCPQVPAEVAAVVNRLMAKNPDERYQVPANVAAALKGLASGAAGIQAGNASAARLSSAGVATEIANGRTHPEIAEMPAATSGPGKPKSSPLRWKHLVPAAVVGAGFLFALPMLLSWPARPAEERKAEAVETPEDKAQAAVGALVARADQPQADRAAIRQELLELRARFPGSRAAQRAAELLGRLPSPLDALDPASVPPDGHVDGPSGIEVAHVLGEVRLRHGVPVGAMALSADGRRIAAGGDSRLVHIWDAATGKREALLAGHQASITSVAWSPDGKFLVSGSFDGSARLWDGTTFKERHAFRHAGPVRTVAISPDGRLIASAGHGGHGQHGGSIRIWGPDGKEQFRLDGHHGAVRALAFAPSGPVLASAGEDKTVRLWDVVQHKENAKLTGHQGPVLALAFVADGLTLASGGVDKALRLWDVEQKKERAPARDMGQIVAGISGIPRTPLLAVAVHDGVLHLLDLSNGQEKAALRGHFGAVMATSASAAGPLLASSGHDGSIRLWDPVKHKETTPSKGASTVSTVALSPDDQTLALGHHGGRIRLWDLVARKELTSFDRHQHGVATLAFSPDGKLLFSGGLDHMAILWDLARRKERYILPGHRATVSALAFAPNGTLAASASHDGTARLWDLATGRERNVLSGHAHALTAVAFSADGKLVATGAADKTLRLWDAATGREKEKFPDFAGDLAFLADGRTVVSGVAHNGVRLWDTFKPRSDDVKLLPGLTVPLRSVALAPDGKTLALGGSDGRLVLWKPTANREQTQWILPGAVVGTTFSGDGRHLVCQLNTGAVYVLRIAPTPRK